MTTPPGEISVINPQSRLIMRANCTGVQNSATTHQYRIHIPGMNFSLVCIDVSEAELRDYIKTAKPVTVKPAK